MLKLWVQILKSLESKICPFWSTGVSVIWWFHQTAMLDMTDWERSKSQSPLGSHMRIGLYSKSDCWYLDSKKLSWLIWNFLLHWERVEGLLKKNFFLHWIRTPHTPSYWFEAGNTWNKRLVGFFFFFCEKCLSFFILKRIDNLSSTLLTSL